MDMIYGAIRLLILLAILPSSAYGMSNSLTDVEGGSFPIIAWRNPFVNARFVTPNIFVNITYPIDGETYYHNTINTTLNLSANVEYCEYKINGGLWNSWADCQTQPWKTITYPVGWVTLTVKAYVDGFYDTDAITFYNFGDNPHHMDFWFYVILWSTVLSFTIISYYARNNYSYPVIAAVGWIILALNTAFITYHGFARSGFDQKTLMAGEANFGGLTLSPIIYFWASVGLVLMLLTAYWVMMRKHVGED